MGQRERALDPLGAAVGQGAPGRRVERPVALVHDDEHAVGPPRDPGGLFAVPAPQVVGRPFPAGRGGLRLEEAAQRRRARDGAPARGGGGHGDVGDGAVVAGALRVDKGGQAVAPDHQVVPAGQQAVSQGGEDPADLAEASDPVQRVCDPGGAAQHVAQLRRELGGHAHDLVEVDLDKAAGVRLGERAGDRRLPRARGADRPEELGRSIPGRRVPRSQPVE